MAHTKKAEVSQWIILYVIKSHLSADINKYLLKGKGGVEDWTKNDKKEIWTGLITVFIGISTFGGY